MYPYVYGIIYYVLLSGTRKRDLGIFAKMLFTNYPQWKNCLKYTWLGLYLHTMRPQLIGYGKTGAIQQSLRIKLEFFSFYNSQHVFGMDRYVIIQLHKNRLYGFVIQVVILECVSWYCVFVVVSKAGWYRSEPHVVLCQWYGVLRVFITELFNA